MGIFYEITIFGQWFQQVTKYGRIIKKIHFPVWPVAKFG
jgi:hypothetical protein